MVHYISILYKKVDFNADGLRQQNNTLYSTTILADHLHESQASLEHETRVEKKNRLPKAFVI